MNNAGFRHYPKNTRKHEEENRLAFFVIFVDLRIFVVAF